MTWDMGCLCSGILAQVRRAKCATKTVSSLDFSAGHHGNVIGWHRFQSLLGFCQTPKLTFEMSARPWNGARLSQCYFYALLSLWAHRLQCVPPNRRCWTGTRAAQSLHRTCRTPRSEPKTRLEHVQDQSGIKSDSSTHLRQAFPRKSAACSPATLPSYPRCVRNPPPQSRPKNSPGPDLGQRRMSASGGELLSFPS